MLLQQPDHQQQELLSIHSEVREGLEFILRHFDDSSLFLLLPRKISTYKSNNKQYLVRSKQEIIDAFIESKFVDCRINAYLALTDYKGIQRHKPNFLFIDLDRNNFKTDRSLKLALSNTLKNIKEQLDSNASPTVLFTGGGYHIYQPIFCPTALENVTEFQKFDNVSVEFLRFAKDNLSSGNADKNNNPSFKSCLLRITGSINSKYNRQVTIVQKWNGYRPPILREFIEEFRTYLIQKKIDEINRQRQKIMLLKKLKSQQNNGKNRNNNKNNYYIWIEKLLETPIEDYRKIVLWKILCPYLINVKRLSYDTSFQILKEWLDKCNSIRKLDFDLIQKIRVELKRVGPFEPIGIEKLKANEETKNLYNFLNKKLTFIQ